MEYSKGNRGKDPGKANKRLHGVHGDTSRGSNNLSSERHNGKVQELLPGD